MGCWRWEFDGDWVWGFAVILNKKLGMFRITEKVVDTFSIISIRLHNSP